MRDVEQRMIPAYAGSIATGRTAFAEKLGWLAAGLFLVAVGAVAALVVRYDEGHLIYFADDTYIHMAIAKNLARHGVWGVTPYGFSAASSSPLWTVLLSAAYLIGGVTEVTPLILNVLFSVGTILLTSRVCRSVDAGVVAEIVSLAAVSLIALFYTFYAMEPTLQFLVTVAFVHVAARALSRPGEPVPVGRLALLAFLATAARYEALALAGVATVLFLIRREWRVEFPVALAALVPPALVGIMGIAHGWPFLPTTVLFKSRLNHLTFETFIHGRDPGYTGLSHPLALLVVLAAALLPWSFRRSRTIGAQTWWLVIFVLTSLAFAVVARLSPVPLRRYEAHLVVLGVIAVPAPLLALLHELRMKARMSPLLAKSVASALALGGIALFAAIGGFIVDRVVTGSGYIYQQQYQMARIVKQAFPGRTVALNDIGAVDFFSEPHLLDLVGLASEEVADAKLANRFDTDVIRSLAREHDVDLVMVYRDWFVGKEDLPVEWKCLVTWHIAKSIGGDVVSFMVTNEDRAQSTLAKLQAFSPKLPRTVSVEGCPS